MGPQGAEGPGRLGLCPAGQLGRLVPEPVIQSSLLGLGSATLWALSLLMAEPMHARRPSVCSTGGEWKN